MKSEIEKLIEKYTEQAEKALRNSKEYEDCIMRSQFMDEYNLYKEIIRDLKKII